VNPLHAPDRANARRDFFAFVLVTLLIAWTYAWAPREFRVHATSPEPANFYHEYADAILAGQLSLARAPDPRLAALPDPYDPVANAPYRINDLSYVDGRYFLYHGIVPAALLLAPFRAITGDHLSLVWAAWVFCVVGVAAALATALDIRRTYAPRTSLTVTVGGLAVLGLSQGAHGVLRDGNLNQLPIASAYGFAMIALWAVWKGRPGAARPLRWLAVASLAAGLAVGSRPNYVFGVSALLGVALLYHLRARPSRKLSGMLVLAGILPLASCVAVILALNHVRFGNPLEFGMRSMLGAWDQRQLPSLASASVWANLHHYLWAPGIYSIRFPFVAPPSWQSIGVLLHAPIVFLAILVLLVVRRGTNAFRAFALPLTLFAGVNFAVLVFLPSGDQEAAPTSANVRYLLDWQPAWVLLAVIAAFGASHALAVQTGKSRLFSGGVLLLATVSILAGMSLDLGRYPLASIRTQARWLSQPAWWIESLSRPDYGPVALELTFPADRTGTSEPLLAIGDATAGDLVHVIYDAPGVLRFALVSVGRQGPVSAPVKADPGAPHRVELELGSLNPPVTHPRLARFTDDDVAAFSRRLIIRLDGQTVMDVPAAFAAPSGSPVQIGRTNFLLDYATETFSGRILRQERLPLTTPANAATTAVFGPLRLTVRFPPGRTGGAEPLLTTGRPQAGDVVYVRYEADGTIRVGVDHWGHGGLLSEAITIDREKSHDIVIEMGSLYPDERHVSLASLPVDRRRKLKQQIRVRIDDATVLEGEQATYDSTPADVYVGKNPIGASSAEYAWTGEIIAVERLPTSAP
jgi:hypothetical protein